MVHSEEGWFAAEQDGLSRSRMVYSGAGWFTVEQDGCQSWLMIDGSGLEA
jgi:hypothetical protein